MKALWILPLLMAAPAVAQPVLVRVGDHERFGRVVFEFADPQAFTVERSGNAFVLHFPGAGDIPDATAGARNVVAVTGGGGMATITVSPRSRVNAMTIGSRVVVDILDPKAAKPELPWRTHASALASRAGPSLFHDRDDQPSPEPAKTLVAPPVPDEPAKPASLLPPPEVPPAARPSPVPRTTVALAATHGVVGQGVLPSSFLFPFDASVGAAVFQHGEEAWLVFDDRRPLDLHALGGDRLLADAVVELLPSATLIRFKRDHRIRLDRQAEGWVVKPMNEDQSGPALMPSVTSSQLLFAAPDAGQVVVVPDPESGRNLLVGTLRAFGPGVPATVRAPEFTIVPTWQGVVIEPISDRVVMRPVAKGFVVETGSPLSADNGPALAGASVLTRRFDFPNDPVASLLRRLQAQTQDEGHAPAQSRLELRKATAQTMLALGLGAEAQSLLRLALAEDPRAVADPDLNGLAGIAAIVSGRPLEAGGLDMVGLSGTDDVRLWRAVRMALLDDKSPEAAQAFAATVGLVLAYPAALRNRLLPLAAETMVAGGASKAVDALLAKLSDEPLLTYARATRMEQKGETTQSLTLYDALAGGRDRLTSARAATRAVLLRLASGSISPGEAATSLERGFGNWRGDARERDLRLQTADIQAEAGRWREALATLRETSQRFSESAQPIDARAAALFEKMLHGPGATAVKPLDLVTLAEENVDLAAKSNLPELAPLLADKLAALDLPDRAGPVIERMITAAPVGVSRAIMGSRLAAMRLSAGDVSSAAAALSRTETGELPPAVAEERGLLQARIAAANHDVRGAAAVLAQIDTAQSADLLATILGNDGDWRGASLALDRLVGQTVPDVGPLTPEQQDTLLRLASAQARAGDEAGLRKLGGKYETRMVGARVDLFRLLTSAPVTAASDLRRSGQELAMIHDLPAAISTVGRR